MNRRAVFVAFLTVLLSRSASCTTVEAIVELFGSSFLPESVTIDVGGTVRWQWIRGEHTVTSGRPLGAPGTPEEAGILFDEVLDEDHSIFEYTFGESPGEGVFFFDRTKPDQLGFVRISSGEVVFRVAVVDNIFNPVESVIFAGDSIRWEHEPGEAVHTVTSGTGFSDAASGLLFDEESSDDRPNFVCRFETAGGYPYYCIPHEKLGMTGFVHVQKNFVRADTNEDGVFDLSDAVRILLVAFLGVEAPGCVDALDGNDDGGVDTADAVFILSFLFAGGPPIPAPFPFPGADRTEDLLRCD